MGSVIHNHGPGQYGISKAMERLLMKDRIMHARTLPTDRELTDIEIAEVRAAFHDVIKDDRGEFMVRLADVAKAIDAKPSTFSQWSSGNYGGNNEKIARKVNAWLEDFHKRQQVQGPRDYIPTWVAEQMIARVKLTHHERRMLAMVSPAGSGKDMVIDMMAAELNGHVVYCDATLSPKQLLLRIAMTIGATKSEHAPAAVLVARIVARLKGRNTVVFINEAQQLQANCAGVIRSLHDQTGISFMLFGSDSIFHFIDDRDPQSGSGQFWRRCNKVDMLRQAAIAPNDSGGAGRALFTKQEIAQFVKMKKLRLADDAALGMLQSIACMVRHGSLGLVNHILDSIAYLFTDQKISEQLIAQVLIFDSDVEADAIIESVKLTPQANQGLEARAG